MLEPHWLDEAYAEAINASDVGLVRRNLEFARITRVVIHQLFDREGRFLDFAGGTGLLVRLMRDAGYDFYWRDRYCTNLFARGFEAPEDSGERFELVTAVEVLEHCVDPLAALQEMLTCTESVLLTTELLPDPPPAAGDWWYYGLEHGQHVSFYTRRSLEILAARLGMQLVTNGRNLHLLSPRRVSGARFRLLTQPAVAALLSPWVKRPSLQAGDLEQMQAEITD